MVSVAQDDLCVYVVQILRRHGFNRAVCAHGHEYGGFYFAVIEFERAAAGVAVFFVQGEVEHKGLSVFSGSLKIKAAIITVLPANRILGSLKTPFALFIKPIISIISRFLGAV